MFLLLLRLQPQQLLAVRWNNKNNNENSKNVNKKNSKLIKSFFTAFIQSAIQSFIHSNDPLTLVRSMENVTKLTENE